MKKITFLLSAFFLMTAVFTQVLYQDDFESFTLNQGIAQQSATWDTWTSSPGTAEDPLVSDAFALSGTQSVKVAGSNDGVIVLNDLTTNRYRIEFYIYVPTGRQAYYNLMQNFDAVVAANNVWGMQIFFKNGEVKIDGGGAAAATFSFQHDTWIKMQHFVDLDNDWVDISVNDTLVHAYQWSQGTFNDGTGINKLDAINFYAWNQGGTPEYYMDDMIIEQVPSPEPPQNFTAQIISNNDVELSWNSPISGTPVSYAVVRDGQLIASIVDDSTYTDVNLYPNSYTYQLYAYYGISAGYSASAGTQTMVIQGGNPRELVLFEIFTGTWCGYCPIAAQAITQMENQGRDIAVIEYHGGDIFETPNTAVRANYYSPLLFGGTSFGYPGNVINGMYGLAGALQNVTQHRQMYDFYYNQYKSIPTVHTIDVSVTNISGTPYNFDITVDVEETFAYFTDEMRLVVALTETAIPHTWGGLSQVKNVLRKMYPNANGTVVDFGAASTHSYNFTLQLENDYNPLNTRAVIFLQNWVTGHVMEAALVDLGALVSSIDETTDMEFTIFPNPVENELNIRYGQQISAIQIYDITGRLLDALEINGMEVRLNMTPFASGMYIVKAFTNDGIFTAKVNKR